MASTRHDYDVIIAGGGPVGMGLAIDLGQRGVRVGVIERHPQPQPIPKGQNLTQRTMESMAAWHCEEALRDARVMPPGVANGGIVAHGTLLSGHAYDWLSREKVAEFYDAKVERLPQYRTEEVLRARAAEIESIDLLYGQTFAAIEQDARGVEVTMRDADGAARTVTGRYAVGCDGSRSALREAAHITQTRSDHDRRMVLLVFRSTELHEMLETRYGTRSFYNVLSPALDGYWLFFGRVDIGETWFFHAPVPEGTTEDNFDFHAYLAEAVGRDFALDIDYCGFWDLRVAIADDYRNGRVFIAGDAAHSHPPYGGYGINTGFEDARNLGWKLAAAVQGWGGEALLASYDAERRPVFASTARDFIERFIEEDRAFLARYDPARDLAEFEAAWAARGADTSEVSNFAPNYEGSPLVGGEAGARPSARGDHSHRARAGHHLSPQKLSDGRSVFARFEGGFTLVALGEAAAAVVDRFARAAEAEGLPLTVVRDAGAAAEAAAEAWGATLVLVRPDEFVAWAGEAETAGEAGEPARVLARAVARDARAVAAE